MSRRTSFRLILIWGGPVSVESSPSSTASSMSVGLHKTRCSTSGQGEPLLDLAGNWLSLDALGIVRSAYDPDAGLEPLDREFARSGEAMDDVKARIAELANRRFHHHVVAIARRGEEARPRFDQRKAREGEYVVELEVVEAQHALEQMGGRLVEDHEIARIEHDP